MRLVSSLSALSASLLAALALAACDPSPPSEQDAGAEEDAAIDAGEGPGDLRRDYCEPFAAMICERLESCGCGEVLPGGSLDRGGCLLRATDDCARSWGRLVSAGSLAIDAASAGACVELLAAQAASCQLPHPRAILDLCPPFLLSPAALGETCEVGFCAGGEGICLGTCRRRGGEGESCEGAGCAVGLLCLSGACHPPGGEGDPCGDRADCAPALRCVGGRCATPAPIGEACESDEGCALGLVCASGSCTERESPLCSPELACGNLTRCAAPRICQPHGGVGEECANSEGCDAAHYCEAGACQPRPAAGEPCADGILCAPGLGCDLMGETLCQPLGGVGEACLFGSLGPSLCADGLGCLAGTCGPLPGEGEECTVDSRCAAGLGCDFSPAGSLCIVPRAEGGSCESDRSCREELHCGRGGACVADLPAGSPCEVGNECEGICGLDDGGGLICRDRPSEGEACLFDEDCGAALRCGADASGARCLPELCEAL